MRGGNKATLEVEGLVRLKDTKGKADMTALVTGMLPWLAGRWGLMLVTAVVAAVTEVVAVAAMEVVEVAVTEVVVSGGWIQGAKYVGSVERAVVVLMDTALAAMRLGEARGLLSRRLCCA